ncbi:unnamed protein product [Jaminaea pallidilutea]
MANATVRNHQSVHGTNPQFLISKVIRSRIYDSLYWKKDCFALTSASLLDRAVELDAIGGIYAGAQKTTDFICLLLKLLQLQPQKEIVLEYLAAKDFKYLRALAAFYVRLVFPSIEVYSLLEPMLEDYRKIRRRQLDGSYALTHLDVFVDELLSEETVCEVVLPRLTKREVLEETEGIEPRISKLEEALLAGEEDGDDGSDDENDEEFQERKGRWKEKLRRRFEARNAQKNKSGAEVAALSNGHAGNDDDGEGEGDDGDGYGDDGGGYASQELSDEDDRHSSRYISRSPSPDADGDRYMSRSPSPGSAGEEARYVSRSPSVSGSEDGRNARYISRSPSKSPAQG